MEKKLTAVFMYDKDSNELSTLYKLSQLSEDSILLGVFETYMNTEETPRVTEYVFFERLNAITTYFKVYYEKVRSRELYLDALGDLCARYHDKIKVSTYVREWNRSSLDINQQVDVISQLGFDSEVTIPSFMRSDRLPITMTAQHDTVAYGLDIMSYLDSDEVRDIPVKNIDGDLIDIDDDIMYTMFLDRLTYEDIDNYDLVYAHDLECYVDESDATYIVDADYYVVDIGDYYQCEDTMEWYTAEGIVQDDYTTLSRQVYEDSYFTCEHCGQIHHLDYMQYDEYTDEMFCEDCWTNRSGSVIREYHDNPRLTRYTTTGTFNGGYGFELEVDNSDSSTPYDLAVEIDNEIEEVWLTKDGSLTHGLEIVSHPMTLDYIMDKFDMNYLCDTIKRHGFKSHNTSTCGLHVHASRELFGESIEEQELTIAKIILLFNRFYDDEIVTFSRRRYDRLVQWAKKSSVKIEYNDKTSDISDKIQEARRDGRYQAINLTNRSTVEFRIFRGTNKASTIIASIQFIDELINYAKTRSLYVCTLVKFKNIFKNTKHTELKNYLIDRKLMKEGEFKLCV